MNEYEGLLKPGLPLTELSHEETETFVRCALMERHDETQEEIRKEVFGSAEAPFQLKVMRARLRHFQDRLSPSLVLYLVSVCSNVAQVVQWAHALVLLAKRNPGKVVGFDIWTTSLGDGLPTPEAYMEAWDEQKGKYQLFLPTP